MRRNAPQPAEQGAPGEPPVRRAFRSPAAIATFLIVAAAGLAADLASKHAVFSQMLAEPELAPRAAALKAAGLTPEGVLIALRVQKPVAPRVSFTLSANPGIVFSLPAPFWLVATSTGVVLVMVVVFFATSPVRARLLHLGLAAVLAGALGNLYDRAFAAITLPGGAGEIRRHVRDFIDCSQLYYGYIFNIADVLLVVGVGLLLLHSFFGVPRKKSAAPSV